MTKTALAHSERVICKRNCGRAVPAARNTGGGVNSRRTDIQICQVRNTHAMSAP